MKFRRYKLAVAGLATPKGTITFGKLIEALHLLGEGSQKALRLAIEGTSSKVGPLPKWVQASSEFIFRGIKPGSAILEFDAPALGETAKHQIRQDGLWYRKPESDDTAITVLSQAVSAISEGELESEKYDKAMLDTLVQFKDLLDKKSSTVKLFDVKENATLFSIDESSVQRMRKISASFPSPRPTVVSGELDMMEKSTRKFKLRISDGHVVTGRIVEGSVGLSELKSMWGTKVTVKGTMHYTANGKPRLLEADLFRAYEEGDLLFEQAKLAGSLRSQINKAKQVGGTSEIVSDIWGKWPGEESIEELLEMTRDKG